MCALYVNMFHRIKGACRYNCCMQIPVLYSSNAVVNLSGMQVLVELSDSDFENPKPKRQKLLAQADSLIKKLKV